MKIGETPVIVTVSIDAGDSFENGHRLTFLHQMVQALKLHTEAPFLLLLPAGFLASGSGVPSRLSAKAEKRIAKTLSSAPTGSVVCVGIDGRDMSDQLGLAIDRTGLLAMARKFYPAGEESKYLIAADSPWSQENGKNRAFVFGGQRFYMAICYDAFGIKKCKVPHHGVDAIVNLVHGFTRPPEPGSGSFYFTRDGVLGAARSWGCPAFVASAFWGGIHRNWPTGVIWNKGDMVHKNWRLTDNPLKPDAVLQVSDGREEAVLSMYGVRKFARWI